MDDEEDFLRTERTEPLTMKEVRVLGMILTPGEFDAVMELQDLTWIRSSRRRLEEEMDEEETRH